MKLSEMYPNKIALAKATAIILWDSFVGIFIPTFYAWVTYQLYLSTIEVEFGDSNVLLAIVIAFCIGGIVGMGALIHTVGQDILKQRKRFLNVYHNGVK